MQFYSAKQLRYVARESQLTVWRPSTAGGSAIMVFTHKSNRNLIVLSRDTASHQLAGRHIIP